MKTLLMAICTLLLVQFTTGQTLQKIRKVVPVLAQQTFYLNGGVRASFGGKSRTYYAIDLPKNTIEWYYTFTTSEGKPVNSAALNLVPQLTRLIDPTGITALLASAIITPTGSNVCDIYLMDRANVDGFINKVDNDGGHFLYFGSGSRLNYLNGSVQVRDAVNGTLYLGFKNPSETAPVTVSFEVAAIVEETVINKSQWSTATKDRFYSTFYQNFRNRNVDETLSKELSSCIVSKIAETKTPAEYDNMAQNERESFVAGIITSCSKGYITQSTPEQGKAVNYGTLGWRAFENGDLDKCIEYSKKALSLDNTLGVAKVNLGLCYLIKGEESVATDYYVEGLSDIKKLKMRSQIKIYLQGAIDDISNAQKKYPNLKGSEDIKSLFQGEIRNY
jgi:hypothetical protein